MIRYKGCNIYSSYKPSYGFVWRVQVGYNWLKDYKSLSAAKSAVSQKWSKEQC